MRRQSLARVAACLFAVLCAPAARGQTNIDIEADGKVVAVFVGTSPAAVYRVDPATGAIAVLSGPLGTGVAFQKPVAVSVHPDGSLRVADGRIGTGALLRVDPLTGDRTVVADAATGSGPPITASDAGFISLAVAPDGVHYLIDYPGPIGGPGRVLRVDAAGNRTVIADPTTGSGLAFGQPQTLTVESDGALAVADIDARGRRRILRIDPSTGVRSLLSGTGLGSGPPLKDCNGLIAKPDGTLTVLDSGGPRACLPLCPHPTCLICITQGPSVMDVDPDNGDRELVSGGGQCLGNVFGCAIPPLGGQGGGVRLDGDDGVIESELSLLVADFDWRLFRVDETTGRRRVVASLFPPSAQPRHRAEPVLPASTPVVRLERPRAWLRQALGPSLYARFAARRPLSRLFEGLSEEERRELGERLYPALRRTLAGVLDQGR